ncbi:hypothetical protein SASPL_132181 [Salvia splendens]|uniref:Amidase domain-containing protein n=1 Tax=Salvia splendens TaxID=180675 RepID=A0A8X8XA47_SALSN|nr:hypothetical protein SASPL_132181 [Salvia splendens]
MSNLSKLNVSNPKVWVVIGVGLAGVLILAEVHRRRLNAKSSVNEDFGAFVERFELLPYPQPPPPAARLPLSGLTFAISDNFDVKGYITGYGSADWKRTHEATSNTAEAVKTMLRSGATCVGKTVMDQLGFGIIGENKNYGTPINPQKPSSVPGGSSSGSAVAVAAQIVDFALGIDSVGCIRVPAAFCGIFGFRPSHGLVSTVGVLPNSQSLDTIGWFASDPSMLHRVGHALLRLSPLEPKRTRHIIIADDLFQLSKVPLRKTVSVVSKAMEKLSGYGKLKHIQFGQFIASNVPSLELFFEESSNKQTAATLRALSSAMLLLRRHEFKINHEEWVKSIKPRICPDISNRDNGILIIPTVCDPPLKLNSKKSLLAEFHDRTYALLGITSMSGGCQAAIPLGIHDDSPVSISLVASHGIDKFLLDTVLDMYSSLQQEVSIISSSSPLPDTNSNMDTAELLKEKGNAAYKGKQWNKAVNFYTEAIKLNDTNAAYYSNRAAAYLELGCYQQGEEDCSKAISLDKKVRELALAFPNNSAVMFLFLNLVFPTKSTHSRSHLNLTSFHVGCYLTLFHPLNSTLQYVKAYLRRGTAKESLLFYKEAAEGQDS